VRPRLREARFAQQDDAAGLPRVNLRSCGGLARIGPLIKHRDGAALDGRPACPPLPPGSSVATRR
jgi:hypothetical protein